MDLSKYNGTYTITNTIAYINDQPIVVGMPAQVDITDGIFTGQDDCFDFTGSFEFLADDVLEGEVLSTLRGQMQNCPSVHGFHSSLKYRLTAFFSADNNTIEYCGRATEFDRAPSPAGVKFTIRGTAKRVA